MARAKSRNQSAAIERDVRNTVKNAAARFAAARERQRRHDHDRARARARPRSTRRSAPARMFPATSVPVETGVTRYPSWYPYIRSSSTCRRSGHHRAHEDREAHDRRPEIRQVVEVRVGLEAHRRRRRAARSSGPPTSCQICPSADCERVEREPVRVVADERRRGPARREAERQHPDAAVEAAPQPVERLRAIRQETSP